MSFEFPLVFFTVLTQLGTGMAIFLCWHLYAAREEERAKIKKAWICISAVSCLGLILSLFHLGHPLDAYKALYNLGDSWLSREGLGFACFCLLAVLNIFCLSKALALATALAGAFSLFAQGMTYSPPSIPALHNALPMAIFWLSALALGGCAIAAHLQERQANITRFFVLALLIVLLAGPAIWISGTATMRESSLLWAASPWFWAGILLIAGSLAMSWLSARVNLKIPALCLLCGIICTRLAFFADSVHTATNLGLPFN